MKNFLIGLLDLIYKKRCYFCKSSRENKLMCSNCYSELTFNNNLAVREFDGVKIFCAGVYEKNIQKLIRGIKYHNKRDLAYYQAKFMYEYFENIGSDKKFIIVPVPLFVKRQKKRGYNHMELVGEEFSKLSGFKMNTDLVKRVKETKPQYKLKKYERMENLKDAFKVSENTFDKDCDILIIDDIYTTGSTFEEMIKEFRKNGFNNITCFATATAR